MKQFPFHRQQRLLKPSEYKNVFDHVDGRVSHSGFLFLANQAKESSYGRLGLVVSKKNLRKAVDRNRFKRLVRNAFRLEQNKLKGLDVVVLARSGALKMDNPELSRELHKAWIRLAKRCTVDISVQKTSNSLV